MVNYDIQKSQHLLKRLEKEMNSLDNLVSQALTITSNLKGLWTAIEQSCNNWKRETENL